MFLWMVFWLLFSNISISNALAKGANALVNAIIGTSGSRCHAVITEIMQLCVMREQWRAQKFFMGVFSFSGVWWSLVFGVHCL